MTDVNDEAREIAIEASQPAKFSLLDRLANRNMPTDTVTIYLDEDAAYHRQLAKEEIAVTMDGDKLSELEQKIVDLTERIKESKVELKLRAIDSNRYEQLLAEVEEIYPAKTEITTNPLTGQRTISPKSDPEREEYFDQLYLAEIIVQAEAYGEIDDDINVNWVKEFYKLAPLDGIRRLVATAFKMRMVGQWMEEIETEDFSPKS